MEKVVRITKPKELPRATIRVAAYVRVSEASDRLMNSFYAQVSYYNSYIKSNSKWQYVGIYSDEAITGTKTDKRAGFKRLIQDCEAGKIDVVITKSISRFGRNTVDVLNAVRRLKGLGIDVYFEKENIHSIESEGELVLSILASVAQEEVRNLSGNVYWAKKKKMDNGMMPSRVKLLGYKWEEDKLAIDEREVGIVKRIFQEYLDGSSPVQICKGLNDDGITTIRGCIFYPKSVYNILRNVSYKGDLLLQKSFTVDPITKVRKSNTGELPMIYVEDDHEAIIEPELFDKVQEVMAERKDKWLEHENDFKGMKALTWKVKCGKCGRNMNICKQGLSFGGDGTWRCSSKQCKSSILPDIAARQSCKRALGIKAFEEELVREKIESVIALEDGKLDVVLDNGDVYHDMWNSRHESVPLLKGKRRPFNGKLKCGICGQYYKSYSRMRNGIRSVDWLCPNRDNGSIHENILKKRICEAVGLEQFETAKFNELVEEVIMDKPCHMNIHMKDGTVKEAEYYSQDRRKTNGKENNSNTCD